jgi:hypothetical protein
MARFLKAPQQQMVDMTSQPMAPFYISLMEKHQQNLDKATGMKMEYIDKINQIPIYTDEDRKSTVGLAEERLSEVLNEEFVSPTRLANTLMQVNKEISPGIQALKAKAQAGEMYDKMRIQWGANALLGDDPRNLSIRDDAGSWRGLNDFKAIGMNKEDIRKDFLQSANKYLTEVREEKVPTDVAGYYRFKKTTGLQDPNMFKTGSEKSVEFAERYIQTNPQILDIFKGNPEEAKNYLMQEFESAAGAYTPKEEYDRLANPYDRPVTDSRGDTSPENFGEYRIIDLPDTTETSERLKIAEDYAEKAKVLRTSEEDFGNVWNKIGDYTGWTTTLNSISSLVTKGNIIPTRKDVIDKISNEIGWLILDNKELYNRSAKELQENRSLQREYGLKKGYSSEEFTNATNSRFLDNMSKKEQAGSAKGVLSIRFNPSEVSKLTPDLKAIILPNIKGITGSDDAKAEEIFNGSSYELIPSRGVLNIHTSSSDAPISIKMKELDVSLGNESDFVLNVGNLQSGKTKGDSEGFVYSPTIKAVALKDYDSSLPDSMRYAVLGVKKENGRLYEYLLEPGEDGYKIITSKGKDLKREVNMAEYNSDFIKLFKHTFSGKSNS